MKILITGGMGEIGRPTAQWLTARGHEVRVLDLRVSESIPGIDCRQGDVTDLDAVQTAMDGIDGVVHLAAYRHPSMASTPEMFRVNALGTVNVFHAAAQAGIRRVVCASSINALGYNFGIKFPPGQLQYFPLDEAHPTFTTDPYSFSKHVIEDIGAYYWRREAIASVFLRFPAVYDLSIPGPSILRDFVNDCYAQTAAILAMPEPARTGRAREIVSDFERRATAREWETQFDLSFPDGAVMFGRSNFWTSLDVRDAAQAIEKSLLAGIEGSHAIYVTDAHNFTGLPTWQLAAVFFPDVTMWKRSVSGTETLVSIERAKALIGFVPRFPYPQTQP